jgi:hypothetical protein
MHPSSPWGVACTIHPEPFIGRAKAYGHGSAMWAGSVESTAFNIMVNEWTFHNANFEVGRYAHYYIAKPLKRRVDDTICEGRR